MSVQHLRWFEAARYVGIALMLAAVTGCDRKQGEPTREGVAPPEVATVPRIGAARPESATTGGTGPGVVGEPLGNSAPGTPGTPLPGTPAPGTPNELASGDHREAKAKFKAASGYKLSGKVEFEEVANGVKVV